MASDRRDRERRGRADYGEAVRSASQGGSTSIKLPPGCEWYESEEGNHDVDPMPYLAGKNNPDADEGFEICFLKYVVHSIPGMDGKKRKYCCLDECFGEKCPACVAIGSGRLSEEQQKSIAKQTRRLWLFNDHPGDKKNPPGCEKNPWKVFDAVHWNRNRGFGQMMFKEWDLTPKHRNMDMLDGGYTVRLRFEKAPNGRGGTWNEVTRIDFTKRDYVYPEELIEQAPCLDACLVKTSTEDMEHLLEGGILAVGGTEEADDRPSARSRRDEDERPASRGENGHSERGRGRDEEERPTRKAPSRDDEDDDRPARKPAPRDEDDDDRPASRKKVDEDDDDRPAKKPPLDKDDDDKPAKKSSGATAADFKAGEIVFYEVNGKDLECSVIRTSADGKTLNIEDEDGKIFKGVDPAALRKWKGRSASDDKPAAPAKKEEEPPAKAKGRSTDDDILDDDDERPARPATKKLARDEDDDGPLKDEDGDDSPRARTSRR